MLVNIRVTGFCAASNIEIILSLLILIFFPLQYSSQSFSLLYLQILRTGRFGQQFEQQTNLEWKDEVLRIRRNKKKPSIVPKISYPTKLLTFDELHLDC